MITIGGTDYVQPTNMTITDYAPSYYVMGAALNNAIFLIPMSQFLAATPHNHAGQWLYPARLQNNATSNLLLTATGGGTINLVYNGPLMLTGGVQHIEIYGKVHYYPLATNEIKIMGPSPGNRTALADAWNLYACSLLNKTDVVEIENAVLKCISVRGITFKQDGVEKAGIAAEDLELLALPGLTTKDKDGKYESVNPVGTIPLIFRAIKEMWAALTALTLRVVALEQRKL